jgi:hypothetical protein
MSALDLPTNQPDQSASSVTLQALLACGVLYSLTYVVANDLVAAAHYKGYSSMSQAVSELSATGAPTKTFLTAMLPVWTALMIAFGVGVWRSARGRRALKATAGLLVAFGVTGVLWLAFPMTSRDEMVKGTTPANDIGHLVLTAATILFILGMIGFAASAFGKRFRRYSIVTAATVLVFGALTGMESPRIPKGEPTPWLGLSERISIGAWLVWMVVLAIILIREQRVVTAAVPGTGTNLATAPSRPSETTERSNAPRVAT